MIRQGESEEENAGRFVFLQPEFAKSKHASTSTYIRYHIHKADTHLFLLFLSAAVFPKLDSGRKPTRMKLVSVKYREWYPYAHTHTTYRKERFVSNLATIWTSTRSCSRTTAKPKFQRMVMQTRATHTWTKTHIYTHKLGRRLSFVHFLLVLFSTKCFNPYMDRMNLRGKAQTPWLSKLKHTIIHTHNTALRFS